MPRLELRLDRDFSYGENGAVVSGHAVLRRVDGGGLYDPSGSYSAEVFETTPRDIRYF